MLRVEIKVLSLFRLYDPLVEYDSSQELES